jgi:type IV secretion system protein VirB10
VVINLASPASDALGTAGLPGYVDNRWSDRIGAAVLLSLVQDAIGYATANAVSQNGGGASIGLYAFQNTRSTGERMVNQILQQTIAIKPTLYKNQGDRASIYVARDLDFSSVYQLTNR